VSRTSSAASTDIGFLLAKASARINEVLLARFAERGFPEIRASYGSVLVPLFGQDGMRLGELAEASRLSKQAMTGLVAQCEAAGLVERQRDPTDGRAYIVRLSERGRSFRGVAERVLDDLDEQLRALLGTATTEALINALKGVMEL
jgi:DNA-binding MarR family transcriptional regulator